MSDRLRVELRAYSLCKKDDAWAESVHRNVSHFARTRASAQLPYLAASQRLAQNLAAAESLSSDALQHFYQCMRRYKAIGQRAPTRALALRGIKRPIRQLVADVYRIAHVGLRDWAQDLGSVVKLAVADADRPRRTAFAS